MKTQKLVKNKTGQTYFSARMAELGVSDELNTVTAEFDFLDDHSARQVPLFSENSQGGIDILYVGLQGVKSYLKNGKKELPYVRTRNHPEQCKKGLPRYLTPKGAGTQVFIPPMLLDAYSEKKEINTLVITEGEFKAFKACMHGLYCLGSQGIHNLHEKDENGNSILNTEITAIIQTCQVKNVILLLDNDCLTVEYEADKDLAKRPYSFYTAVKNFREYTKRINCDVYFSHLNTDLTTKGIDDLLCSLPDDSKKVVEDLLSLKQKTQYFYTLNITDKSLTALKGYFHLSGVKAFYESYKDIITDKVFKFMGFYYQSDGKDPKMLVSEEVNRFVRIGDIYYKRIYRPDKTGKLEPCLEKRSKTTIIDDYGVMAIKHIKKYEAFCLVPSHVNYQQEIANCYNAYHKLSHEPAPGTIENSLKMVNHIFRDKAEFGLDYIQLLYTKPDQLLPIILLQSEKRGTGKSTFGQWLIDIFESNASKLGNQDLESDFNSTYVERLLIVVDETALSKKVTSEAIKKMSTEQGKVWVNAKGMQQYETDWIGKFVFITNNENTSLYIGKGETRYFVRTIEPFTGGDEKADADMLEKLRDEIPAFLHYLQERKLHHPRKGRMYFDFEVFKTPELHDTIDANISVVERELRQLLADSFDAFPGERELCFSINDLFQELKEKSRYGIDESTIRNSLKRDFKIVPDGQRRYNYHSLRAYQLSHTEEPLYARRNGRPYVFKRSDYGSY